MLRRPGTKYFPLTPSIDRIDNSKLHTAENCQLVCLAVQLGSNAASVDDTLKHLATIKLANADEDTFSEISDEGDSAIEDAIYQLRI